MKYISALVFALVFSSPAFASIAHIDLINASPTYVTMIRDDGLQILLHPNQKISGVKFHTRSYVYNYVNGNPVCSWYIESKLHEKTHELIYNPAYGIINHTSPCVKTVTHILGV